MNSISLTCAYSNCEVFVLRLEQFEAIIAVVHTKSMQKAADILHTSVQNVSKLVKQLEEELQVQIFIRNKFGLFLTKEGENIYDYCTIIMDNVNKIKYQYIPEYIPESHDASSEALNILTEQALTAISYEIMEKIYKEIGVDNSLFVSKDAAVINQNISDNGVALFENYDIVFTNVLQSDLQKFKTFLNEISIYFLFEDRLAIRINDTHPLARQKMVGLKDLINLPLILALPETNTASQMQLVIESLGIPLKPKYVFNSPLQVSTYISKNSGYTFVTKSGLEMSDQEVTNTVIIPLKEIIKINHICLVKESQNNTRALQKYLNLLNKKFKKIYKIQ